MASFKKKFLGLKSLVGTRGDQGVSIEEIEVIRRQHLLLGQEIWSRSKADKGQDTEEVTIAAEAARLAEKEAHLEVWLQKKTKELTKFYHPKHWYQTWWLNPVNWFKERRMSRQRLLCAYIVSYDDVSPKATLTSMPLKNYGLKDRGLLAVVFKLGKIFSNWFSVLAGREKGRVANVNKIGPKGYAKLDNETDRESSLFARSFEHKQRTIDRAKREAESKAAYQRRLAEEKACEKWVESYEGRLQNLSSSKVPGFCKKKSEAFQLAKQELEREWELQNPGVKIYSQYRSQIKDIFDRNYQEACRAEGRVEILKAQKLVEKYRKRQQRQQWISRDLSRLKELGPVIEKLKTMIVMVTVAKAKGWSTPLKIARMMVKHNNLAANHGLTRRPGTTDYDYKHEHDMMLLRRQRPDMLPDHLPDEHGIVTAQPCRDDFRLR